MTEGEGQDCSKSLRFHTFGDRFKGKANRARVRVKIIVNLLTFGK